MIEVPYIFAQALVYGLIVYAMIGFEWTVAKFLWYLFFMFFTLLYFTFYGMMSVAVTPNHHIASIVAAAFYSIWNLFSGFLIPRPVRISLSSNPSVLPIGFRMEPHSVLIIAENPNLVEVVLLDLPRCVDLVRVGCVAIRRRNRKFRRRQYTDCSRVC